jgi:fermentation-respiration switch protein FrsA (DUF1100 family)
LAFFGISKFVLLCCILALSGCSSLLYFPTRIEHVDRKKMPVQPIDINFPSEDGTNLHAWQFHAVKGESSKCVILDFHGNGQNLSTHFFSLYWVLEHGLDYMIFDYHGYGSSEGKPSPKATVEDGHAALRKIHQLYPDKKIVVLAQSLGGAVGVRSVVDIKNEVPVILVFADSTFDSYRTAARTVLSHHWLTWLFQPIGWLVMSDTYAPGNDVAKLSPIPLVVIHGDQDTEVDISNGHDLFDRAASPKEFWEVPGGHHIDALYRPEIQQRFLDKIDSVCNESHLSPSKAALPTRH